VIARTGALLLHYWRDDAPPYQWHGPTRYRSEVRSRLACHHSSRIGFLPNGYFQVVTPTAAHGLAHYTRDNMPSQRGVERTDRVWRWLRRRPVSGSEPDTKQLQFGTRLTCTTADRGNLELVARAQNVLFHFWRADNTQISDGKPSHVVRALGCELLIFCGDISKHKVGARFLRIRGILAATVPPVFVSENSFRHD